MTFVSQAVEVASAGGVDGPAIFNQFKKAGKKVTVGLGHHLPFA